jgi:hypothetical protein
MKTKSARDLFRAVYDRDSGNTAHYWDGLMVGLRFGLKESPFLVSPFIPGTESDAAYRSGLQRGLDIAQVYHLLQAADSDESTSVPESGLDNMRKQLDRIERNQRVILCCALMPKDGPNWGFFEQLFREAENMLSAPGVNLQLLVRELLATRADEPQGSARG